MTHDVAPWAFREAIAGCYPARCAHDELRAAFEAAKPEADRGEFARIARWAAAQAHADPGQVHDGLPLRWRWRPALRPVLTPPRRPWGAWR